VKLRVRLAGAKNEIDADARVAWNDRRVGMGLQFTRVTPGDQTLIDSYVRSHFFSNRKA
jgi:hypothetical protein